MSPRTRLAGLSVLTVSLAGSLLAPSVPTAAVPAADPSTWSQVPPPGSLITLGGVMTDLVAHDGQVLLRGEFDGLGHFSGPTSLVTGAGDRPARRPDVLDGQVSASVPDGDGGWYVAGDATVATSPDGRTISRVEGLLRLGPDGRVDRDFIPATGERLLNALTLVDDVLYAGGFARGELLAVDTATGEVTVVADGFNGIRELLHLPGDGPGDPGVLVVGSDPLVHVVDLTTGEVVESTDDGLRGPVSALAAVGEQVWVGAEDGLVRWDRDAETFTPVPVAGSVLTLRPDGARVLVGGQLDDGVAVTSVDAATGAPTPGFADLTGGAAHDLALDGERLLVGGRELGGDPLRSVLALDADTGTPSGASGLPSYDAPAHAVTVSSGRTLVGGAFTVEDAVAAPGYAVLDPATGGVTPGTSRPPGYSSSRMLLSDGLVHVTGGRTVRAFDPATGERRDEATIAGTARFGISAATADGSRVVVARPLQRPGFTGRKRFTRLAVDVHDAATGELRRTLRVPLRGYVRDLAVVDGDLVVAGSFKRRRNGSPAHLAALRLRLPSGQLVRGFDPQVDGEIRAVGTDGRRIWVAGLFRRAYGDTVFMPSVARLRPGGFGVARGFFPPGDVDVRVAGTRTLVVLPRRLVLPSRLGTRVLEAGPGFEVEDAFGGFAPEVDGAAHTDAGTTWSATLDTGLRGLTRYEVSFVQTDPAG